MKRSLIALLAVVPLVLTAAPAHAAVTRNVIWRCTLADGSTVDFLSAPDAAYGGLATANKASARAAIALGEQCIIVRG